MAEDQKNARKEFKSCCEGMPFADKMRKMMGAKKSGSSFNCVEMMSQMMHICSGAPKMKEEPVQGTKEKPVPNP